jgi:tetratricopeptide (TPR) repeat protein
MRLASISRRITAGFSVLFMAVAIVPCLSGQENMGRARISGRVVDESGTPVPGAAIVVQIAVGTTKLEGVTDQKGRFAVAGLGSGTWRITASKAGYVEASTELNVSQLKPNPPVDLILKKAAGLQGLQGDKASQGLLDEGNALLAQGNTAGAIALFREFLDKYPDLYQVRLNIAAADVKAGDLDAAEDEYKAVLDKIHAAHGELANDKTTAVRALSGLGDVAARKGDLETSQKFYSEALALSPDDEAAAYNVGEMLFSNQNVDEAIKYFELAARIKEDWPKPYAKLGYAYLNKGDYAKALENFNRFVALDPDGPETPNIKAIIAQIEKIKK